MPKDITKGGLRREQKENENLTQKQQKELDIKKRKLQLKANLDKQAVYKQMVIKAFLTEFANNYGDSFDYHSLLDSIQFKFKEDKNGDLLPDFSFLENKIEFKSDAYKESQPFNENSYSDFISNDDEIDGEGIYRYSFNNSEEYEAYQDGDIDTSDFDDLDGEFIPISDNKSRYGEFNRINKQIGYTPTGESAKSAKQNAIKAWNKLKK